MKKIVYAFILCLACSAAWADEVDTAMKDLSQKIIASYRKLPGAKGIQNVAVLDFENKSMLAVRNNLGTAFSEMMTQHLVRYRDDLRVIERRELGSILREKELKMTGLAGDGADVSAYGEVLGADLLVMGSVFNSGGGVWVNVRVVETAKSQVLLSESVKIDEDAFVEKAQRFVKVTHSISAGYMYQLLDEHRVNGGYIMYTYNFFYGLALNFQMFVGVSDTIVAQDTYQSGASTAVDTYEKSFVQMGLNLLFSKCFDLHYSVGVTPFAGPSVLSYMDKTVIISHLAPTLDFSGPVEITPMYMLFGVRAGVNIEYRITTAYKIILGGEFQYFPDYKITKQLTYQNSMNTTKITSNWNDTIKLTGYSITAGAAYSF